MPITKEDLETFDCDALEEIWDSFKLAIEGLEEFKEKEVTPENILKVIEQINKFKVTVDDIEEVAKEKDCGFKKL